MWERGAGKVQKLEEGRSNSCWRIREFSEEEWTLEEVWKEAQEEGSEWGREDAVHSGLRGGGGVHASRPPPSLYSSRRHVSAGRGVLSKASCTGRWGRGGAIFPAQPGGVGAAAVHPARAAHNLGLCTPVPAHSALFTPRSRALAPTVALGSLCVRGSCFSKQGVLLSGSAWSQSTSRAGSLTSGSQSQQDLGSHSQRLNC